MNKMTITLLISMITNFSLSALKIISGFLGGSTSLIADGVHSFSDLTTDLIAIIGGSLSRKPADQKHPFGHGKIEYLTSIIIAIIILILGLTVISTAFNKQISIPSLWSIWITLITIILKLILSNFIIKQGKKLKNSILIASGKESKMDAISSVCVLISIILMQLSTKIQIFKYADSTVTIIIGILIIKTGYTIIKDNISVLLDEQIIDKKYIKELKKIVLSENQIKEITSFNVLKSGPYYHLLATFIMDYNIPLGKAHDLIDEIEIKLKEKDNKLKYFTIHIEPNKEEEI